MGLDMYAHVRNEKPEKPIDFVNEDSEPDELLFSWRKHPNLHHWMWRLHTRKGGTADDPQIMGGFNGESQVLLEPEDLDQLEKAISDPAFYESGKVTGFFFGSSEPGDIEDDRNFIKMARAAIAEGRFVYYTSWW